MGFTTATIIQQQREELIQISTGAKASATGPGIRIRGGGMLGRDSAAGGAALLPAEAGPRRAPAGPLPLGL